MRNDTIVTTEGIIIVIEPDIIKVSKQDELGVILLPPNIKA